MQIEGLSNAAMISTRSINIRKSPFFFKTIEKKKQESSEKEGWEFIPSKLKKSIKMQKPKPHNVAFEDRLWALFAKMGFDYINANNNFKLEYLPGLKKQIDVFAADSEAIIIVECKSSETRKRISYQKDINELVGIKENLRIAAQKLFPGNLKVAFIFATNNSIVSNNDKQRLKEDSIFYFNQDDIDYFEQLSDHLGSAAKFQMFGKLFEAQKIPELKNRVPAIKGKNAAGHTFYSFSIEPEYLLKIGFILHRTQTSPEVTSAYQRLVKKTRLTAIGKYIDQGGYFPNSLIINIQTKRHRALRFEKAGNIEHDSSTSMGILHLPQTYRSAFIIDGQHRLYGYSVSKSGSHHTVPVVAFHNLPPEEQTTIFIDINHTQKSVPANLLHSIMADFHWNSSNDRLAISALKSRLFMEMNSDDQSPLYKRIIISEEKKRDERCLTLQTIKNWGLSKVNFFGKLKGDRLISTGYLSEVDYEKTLQKAVDFLNTAFSKIEEGLEKQWDAGSGEGGFISMNIGISALIRTLDSIIEYLVKFKSLEPETMTGEEIAYKTWQYLDPVIEFVEGLDSEGIKKLRSLFGSGATEKVLREFQYAIHKEFEDFRPEGLKQWIKDNSGEYNQPAWDLGHNQIEPMIDEFIKAVLKEHFGEKYWWMEGVPTKIQKKCSDDKIDKKSMEPESNFLNTIHYYSIIEEKWTLFGNFFSPPGTENMKKSKRLEWLKTFNSIRQKYSHPQRENTTEKEYNFLVEKKVARNFFEKIKTATGLHVLSVSKARRP